MSCLSCCLLWHRLLIDAAVVHHLLLSSIGQLTVLVSSGGLRLILDPRLCKFLWQWFMKTYHHDMPSCRLQGSTKTLRIARRLKVLTRDCTTSYEKNQCNKEVVANKVEGLLESFKVVPISGPCSKEFVKMQRRQLAHWHGASCWSSTLKCWESALGWSPRGKVQLSCDCRQTQTSWTLEGWRRGSDQHSLKRMTKSTWGTLEAHFVRNSCQNYVTWWEPSRRWRWGPLACRDLLPAAL